MLGMAKHSLFAANPTGAIGGFCYFGGAAPTLSTIFRYEIANDAVTNNLTLITGTGSSATGINTGKANGVAFGNGTLGYWGGGQTDSPGTDHVTLGYSSRAMKMTLADESKTAANNLSIYFRNSCGTCNDSTGIRMGGYLSTANSNNNANIWLYSWSSDAWSSNGSTLANPMSTVGIHSITEFAYRASGYNEQSAAANIRYVNKWTWATSALSSVATVLDEQMGYASCSGNQTDVVIMGGANSSAAIIARVKSIVMATDTRTNRTNLAAGILGNGDAAGDDVVGIHNFDRAASGFTRKYTYSTGSHVQSTQLRSTDIQVNRAYHSIQVS